MFAAEARKRPVHGDAVQPLALASGRSFVKINRVTQYLWRAVDHEGEVLESFVTTGRGIKGALKFLKKLVKRRGRVEAIVTDRLRS